MIIRLREKAGKILKDKNKETKVPITVLASDAIEGFYNPNPKLHKEKGDPRFSRIKEMFIDQWETANRAKYYFTAADAGNLKQLIRKLDNLNESDKPIEELFGAILSNLPQWYKTQNIKVINGKFNELIAEIRAGKQKSSNLIQDGGKYDFRN